MEWPASMRAGPAGIMPSRNVLLYRANSSSAPRSRERILQSIERSLHAPGRARQRAPSTLAGISSPQAVTAPGALILRGEKRGRVAGRSERGRLGVWQEFGRTLLLVSGEARASPPHAARESDRSV